MTAQAPAEPQTKKCPYCAETIRAEAIKCRHCGSSLSEPSPGRLRSLSSSPVLGVTSLVIGVVGGITEALDYLTVEAKDFVVFGDLAVGIVNFVVRGEGGEDDAFGFGPPAEPQSDGAHILILAAAVALGVIGFGGALLVKRRPNVAIGLFVGGGAVGLAITWFAGINLALVALSVLLLLAALATVVASRPFDFAVGKRRSPDSQRGPLHHE